MIYEYNLQKLSSWPYIDVVLIRFFIIFSDYLDIWQYRKINDIVWK